MQESFLDEPHFDILEIYLECSQELQGVGLHVPHPHTTGACFSGTMTHNDASHTHTPTPLSLQLMRGAGEFMRGPGVKATWLEGTSITKGNDMGRGGMS